MRDVCRLYDHELDRPGGFWFIPGFVCTEIASVWKINVYEPTHVICICVRPFSRVSHVICTVDSAA